MVAGRTGSLEVVGSVLGNVRFGSKADISACSRGVRLTPKVDIGSKNKNSRVSFRGHRQLCTFIGKLPAGDIQHV